MRSTCAVARITMMHWDGKLAEFMDVNNIRLEMGARYMDDVRLILDSIHEGWRWIVEDFTSLKAGSWKMKNLVKPQHREQLESPEI